MIEFACDTAAFSDLRLTEALGTIARLGFRYADLDINQHLNLVKIAADPRRIAAELIADLRVYNLKLANASLSLPEALLSEPETERQAAFDQFIALLPLFQELAVPGITLSMDRNTTSETTPSEDLDEETQQAHRADILRCLQAAADPIELRIDADDKDLSDVFEGAGLALDALALMDAASDEDVSALLARTRYITLQASPEGLSRDEAIGLMQTLQEAGYDGVFSIGINPAAAVSTGKSAAPTPPVTAARRVLSLRDTLRAARDQVMAPAKKASSAQ